MTLDGILRNSVLWRWVCTGNKASSSGSDDEILKGKGFLPLLSFKQRKEIALAIRYVEEVIESEWLIDEAYMDFHNIDVLVHGEDNQNLIPPERLVLFPRTEGISSSILRSHNNK